MLMAFHDCIQFFEAAALNNPGVHFSVLFGGQPQVPLLHILMHPSSWHQVPISKYNMLPSFKVQHPPMSLVPHCNFIAPRLAFTEVETSHPRSQMTRGHPAACIEPILNRKTYIYDYQSVTFRFPNFSIFF